MGVRISDRNEIKGELCTYRLLRHFVDHFLDSFGLDHGLHQAQHALDD
jgi:hypothetical protein